MSYFRLQKIMFPSNLVIVIFFISMVALSCGGGGGGSTTGGSNFFIAEGTIGPEGGVVEDKNVNSPTYKTIVDIPKGALDTNVLISFEKVDCPEALPEGNQSIGVCIDFGPHGIKFNEQVLITMPYVGIEDSETVSETQFSDEKISGLVYSENLSRWLYEKVEIVNNESKTVTISTNHFSIRQLSIMRPAPGRNDLQIFTIDGLDFDSIKLPLRSGKMREGYLQPAIVYGMPELNLNISNVYSYGGGIGESWSGDANYTHKEVPTLRQILISEYNKAKNSDKKFIIVSHSWGTVLALLALSFTLELEPDLLITLSSPKGSNQVEANHNEFFGFYLGIPYTVPMIQNLISAYVDQQESKTYNHLQYFDYDPYHFFTDAKSRWVNFWARKDIISGPIGFGNLLDGGYSYVTDDYQIENIQIDQDDQGSDRNKKNCEIYHAITSLDARGIDYFLFDQNDNELIGSWKEFLDGNTAALSLARDFREAVKKQICMSLPDKCEDAPDVGTSAVDDYVWFAGGSAHKIRKVDLEEIFSESFGSPGGMSISASIAVDDKSVWAPYWSDWENGIVEYEKATGTTTFIRLSGYIQYLNNDYPSHLTNIAVDKNFIWATMYSHDQIIRMNKSNPQQTVVHYDSYWAGNYPNYIVNDNDFVWITNDRSNTIRRIPKGQDKHYLFQIVDIGFKPAHITVDDKYVWVANDLGKGLTRVDKATLETKNFILETNTYRIRGVAVDDHFVWAINEENTLYRVNKMNMTDIFQIQLTNGWKNLLSMDLDYVWVARNPKSVRVHKNTFALDSVPNGAHTFGDITGYMYDYFFLN